MRKILSICILILILGASIASDTESTYSDLVKLGIRIAKKDGVIINRVLIVKGFPRVSLHSHFLVLYLQPVDTSNAEIKWIKKYYEKRTGELSYRDLQLITILHEFGHIKDYQYGSWTSHNKARVLSTFGINLRDSTRWKIYRNLKDEAQADSFAINNFKKYKGGE